MTAAFVTVTVPLAVTTAFSATMKIRRDPNVVKIIHEIVGVPMKFFPALAACELAGALGLLIGIRYPAVGLAAGGGLVIYFLGAVVSHLRVKDVKGIGPATFMLATAVGAVAPRMATM
jgi:hypothetical protein